MAITQEKAESIAVAYEKVGYKDKTNALISIGYKPSYARSIGQKLYDNIRVKDAIQAIKDKASQIMEYNYEVARKMITERIGWLDKKAKEGNAQAIQAQTALIRELDDITGLKQQNINITTDQQRELTERQAEDAQKVANILNLQELREA